MLVIFVNYNIHRAGTPLWNETTGWRWMFASGIVPSLMLLILLYLVPETSGFLLMNGRKTEGRKRRASHRRRTSRRPLRKTLNRRSISRTSRQGTRFGIALAILPQVPGINVFLYYAPEIFNHMSHSGNISLLETVLVGAVNLLLL